MNEADRPAIRRSLGLILLVLLTISLYLSKDVILPLLMGAVLALTLVVRALQRRDLAPVVSATALIVLAVVAIAWSALLFGGPVSDRISDAPQLRAELHQKVHTFSESLKGIQQRSSQMDQITGGVADPKALRVAMEQPGQFVTPVILGRQLKLNAVWVFVMMVFWSWLWGLSGALMALPFLVCLTVICDNAKSLQALGKSLGAEETPILEMVEAT